MHSKCRLFVFEIAKLTLSLLFASNFSRLCDNSIKYGLPKVIAQ